MPNNKNHWGDVISSLGEADAVDFEAEDKKAAGSAKSTKKSEEGSSEKPEKKRSSRSAASRKRVPSKKESAAEPAAFERNLLDSLETPASGVALTVGDSEKREKRSRCRTKKSDTARVEKAVAEEEKKERVKRKKLAEAIVEKAKEPFRKIVSQIDGRIQDLAQEESPLDSAERPAKKSRKPSIRRKKKQELVQESAEDASVQKGQTESAGDFWETDESLEISWGRAPKQNSQPEANPEISEPADEVDVSEESFPELTCEEAFGQTLAEKGSEPAKKLSRRDAEERFAFLFEEKKASEDEVEEFRKRSCRPRSARQEESSAESEEPRQLDEDSFWGIPDEPKVGFTSRAEPKPAAKPIETVSEESARNRRNERPEQKEKEQSLPEHSEEPVRHRNEDEQKERRDDRRANRRNRRDRNESPRPEKSEAKSPRPSGSSAEMSGEKAFPTWNDAIGGVINQNIGRHSSSGNRGGDRRKR